MDSETVTKEEVEEKNSTGKPKVVVLYDDPFNTFAHVEKCLMKYCKKTNEQAKQCTMTVHVKGKCVVAEGSDEQLKKITLLLRANGLTALVEDA